MTERIPAQVFCLAEFLSEELVERGWTTDDVALRMGGDEKQFVRDLLGINLIMCVHKDKLLIGDHLFDGLTKVFNVDPTFFRNIDAAWRKYPDRRTPFEPPESIFGPISWRALFHVV